MTERKFSSNSRSIAELFRPMSRIKFKIPQYQRDYSWDSKEINQLWRDLIDSFGYIKNNPGDDNERKAQYFFGPVVIVEDKSEQYFIIDGQQRFTTLAMLFCAARDILDDLKLQGAEIYQDIKRILEYRNLNSTVSWKLELNDTDKDIFKRILNGEGNKITKNDLDTVSQKKLRRCYTILRKNIHEELETHFGISESSIANPNNGSNTWQLNMFINHVLKHNYVTELSVANDGNPYQIFEALNGRGQKLTDTNRIKNHLLEQVQCDENKAQILNKKWNTMFNKIVTKGLTTDQFIMESFQSRYHDAKLKSTKPYSIIKNKVRESPHSTSTKTSESIRCDQYVEELEEDAEFLIKLTNLQVSDSIRHDAEAISLLGAKYIRVPLLAAHRTWETKDYEQLLHILVKFFFKNKTICRRRPGEIEKAMLDTTNSINAGFGLNRIVEELKREDYTKEFSRMFEDYVEGAGKSKSGIAKYILRSVDLYLAKQNQRIDYGRDQLTGHLSLEYVLPSNSDQWDKDKFFHGREEYDDEMTDYVNSLGNLTLLTKPLNSGVKIMPFDKKKNHYELSDLEINRQTVCKYDEWTANVIKEREEDFVKHADDIWRIN